MFDLENAIRDWQQALSETGTVSTDDLLELDEHLREIVAELKAKGCTPFEAFAVAKLRLGDAHDLAAEFGKVNRVRLWRQLLLWMVIGYVGGNVLMSVSTATASLTAMLLFVGGLSGPSVGVAATVAGAILWTTAVTWLYRYPARGWRPTVDNISALRMVGLAIAIPIANAIGMASRMMIAQIMDSTTYGNFVWHQAIGHVVYSNVTIVAWVVVALLLRRDHLAPRAMV
ncbi:MAG: hypothetical protein KDB23_20715 [Planctomycetales bacterium]|nr:hypothetical protein [Planctomycetales bacterium]